MAYGDAFAPVTAFPSLLLRNKIYLAISKCRVKYFEQPALDLYLQLIKVQNSWIWRLMDVSGCLTLLLLKCPCSQTCQLCSAKWCFIFPMARDLHANTFCELLEVYSDLIRHVGFHFPTTRNFTLCCFPRVPLRSENTLVGGWNYRTLPGTDRHDRQLM